MRSHVKAGLTEPTFNLFYNMGPHTFALDKVGVGEQNACEVMDQWIRLCKLESRVDKFRFIGQELL